MPETSRLRREPNPLAAAIARELSQQRLRLQHAQKCGGGYRILRKKVGNQ